MTSRPRILFTCGREGPYVRNLLLLRALRQHFDVVEVTDPQTGSMILRHLRLLPRLAAALRSQFDLVFVGFYGHLLVEFLTHLTRRPILFDAYLSTWDTLCFDRKRFAPRSLPGRLAYHLDRRSCLDASHSLLDTEAHRGYFAQTFGIPPSGMTAYYLGYDEGLFRPQPGEPDEGRFVVFFYGSFVPLHGAEYIVQAAKILEGDPEIEFRIIGEGMAYPAVRQLAQDLQVQRLTFSPSVPYSHLPSAIAAASVCLGGPFGSSAKASRVISSKTFQFLAMAKPTIVGDSPANREVFHHGDDLLMCTMADPQALAAAILELKNDPLLRQRIAQRGAEHCREQFGMEVQGQRLRDTISGLL